MAPGCWFQAAWRPAIHSRAITHCPTTFATPAAHGLTKKWRRTVYLSRAVTPMIFRRLSMRSSWLLADGDKLYVEHEVGVWRDIGSCPHRAVGQLRWNDEAAGSTDLHA